MKKIIVCAVAVAIGLVSIPAKSNADIIEFNYAALNPNLVDSNFNLVTPLVEQALRQAEIFWESRLVDFSHDLPIAVRAQLNPILITPTIETADDVGGVLAFAGPDDVFQWGSTSLPKNGGSSGPGNGGAVGAIAQTGNITFDIEDVFWLDQAGLLDEVAAHEIAHVLGFGTLFEDNQLLSTFFGTPQYVGQNALEAYRQESGLTFAQYIALERGGGAGTAGGHWSAEETNIFVGRDGFGTADLMTGFLSNNPYMTNTTLMAFKDLHFQLASDPTNQKKTNGLGGPKNPGGPRGIQAIPEPSSLAFLAVAFLGFGLNRRRRR